MVLMKDLCRACLCETKRHFYLKADDELRSYEMVTGIELPVKLVSIHLCFRCYKLYDRIISFRQCCYTAEKYIQKCAKNTGEVDMECKERKKISIILQRDMKYELTQSTTICLDSRRRGFAKSNEDSLDNDIVIESGNWKFDPCGPNSGIYFHQRHHHSICDELEEDSDCFYISDDLEPVECTESEESYESDSSEEPAADDGGVIRDNEEVLEGNGEVRVKNWEVVKEKGVIIGEKRKELKKKIVARKRPRRKIVLGDGETLEEYKRRSAKEQYRRTKAKIFDGLREEDRQRIANRRSKELELSELAAKWLTVEVWSVQQVRDALAAHRLTAEFVSAIYKCEPCAKIFDYELQVTEHLVKHEELLGDHVCEVCQQRRKSKPAMINHRRMHLRKYQCKVCDKLFAQRYGALLHVLRVHSRVCQEEQDERATCEMCDRVFKNKVVLKAHQVIHDDNRNFKCSYCPKIYTNKYKFNQHIISQHSGMRPFVCNKCGESYRSRGTFLVHASKHDSWRKVYRCCKRVFTQRSKYNEHLKIGPKHVKPEDKMFMCSMCGDRFLREAYLNRHVEQNHVSKADRPKKVTQLDKNYVCHECGIAYSQRVSLKRHLENHQDVSPRSCPICPQTFLIRSQLLEHLTTDHSPDELLSRKIDLAIYEDNYCEPQKCDQCDKQFKNKRGLKIHYVRVRCVDCRHCFPTERDLVLHRQLYHPTMPADSNDDSAINNNDLQASNELEAINSPEAINNSIEAINSPEAINNSLEAINQLEPIDSLEATTELEAINNSEPIYEIIL